MVSGVAWSFLSIQALTGLCLPRDRLTTHFCDTYLLIVQLEDSVDFPHVYEGVDLCVVGGVLLVLLAVFVVGGGVVVGFVGQNHGYTIHKTR
jgi:hypothetical protein